jgi:hypothetical protein
MSSVIIILCFFSLLFITFVLFTSIGVGGFLFFNEDDEDDEVDEDDEDECVGIICPDATDDCHIKGTCTNGTCSDETTATNGTSCRHTSSTGRFDGTTYLMPRGVCTSGVCTSNTVDACTGDPCGDNAICTVIDTGFRCNCDNGYTGTSTNNQPNCTSNTVDAWILQTTTGQTCDTTCENSGRICTDGNWGVDSEAAMNAALAAAGTSSAAHCNSYAGYSTYDHLPNVQPASTSPGTCPYNTGDSSCSVTAGPYLRLCKCDSNGRLLPIQNQVDACTNDPCGDNATCTVSATGFSCNCDDGYTGTSTTNNRPNCTVANTCGVNQMVSLNTCVPCPVGTTNGAGDDPTGADTGCTANTCVGIICPDATDDCHIKGTCTNGTCSDETTATDGTSCFDGTTAGVCTSGVCGAVCGVNEMVSLNTCVSCPVGTTNDAGDDPTGADTGCTTWLRTAGGTGGGWIMGTPIESCDETCSAASKICSGGDWGVNSEATMNTVLRAAGHNPSTLCESYGSSSLSAGFPMIQITPGKCLYSTAPTGCGGEVQSTNMKRLCKCE